MQKTTRLKKPQVPEQEDWIVFDKIHNRPKYAGEEMTSETDIPSVSAETEARESADREIWTEIEAIEASSDVVDVVGTYAELEAYDTSKLHDKDLIKVLADETRDGAITYYRYSTSTETFTYVGAEGPYYTASETDTLLSAKQDTLVAGSNITIDANNEISAVDTTYTHFTGATASTDGVQGLVPGPLAGDEDKFLQGDGTWGTPTDTTYTAGTNVQISNQNVISATDTTYTAGTNVQISANNEISATDTTYSNFTGTDGTAAGTSGLVPAPATTDAGKFLKADGTWDDAGSSVNVVQTKGTSTTDVMSQDATTKMIYPTNNNNRIVVGNAGFGSNNGSKGVAINANVGDSATSTGIAIGFSDNQAIIDSYGSGVAVGGGARISFGENSIAIGNAARARSGSNGIAIGYNTNAGSYGQGHVGAIAIGGNANAGAPYSIALGDYSRTTAQGQFDVAAGGTVGYNNTKYRLLTGLYPGQSEHDAATVGQLNAISIQYAGTPTTSTVGSVGQLYQDTSNGKLYICTAVTGDGGDPEVFTYTWSEVGTPNIVQTTGQSTTAVMSQKAVTDILGDIEAALQILNSGAGVP